MPSRYPQRACSQRQAVIPDPSPTARTLRPRPLVSSLFGPGRATKDPRVTKEPEHSATLDENEESFEDASLSNNGELKRDSILEVNVRRTYRGYSVEAKSTSLTVVTKLSVQPGLNIDLQSSLLHSAKAFEDFIRKHIGEVEQSRAIDTREDVANLPIAAISITPTPPVFYDATRPDIVLTQIPEPEDMPEIPTNKRRTNLKYAFFRKEPEHHIGQAILRSPGRSLDREEIIKWLQNNIQGFPRPGQREWKYCVERALKYHLSSVGPYFDPVPVHGPPRQHAYWPLIDFRYEIRPGQEFRFVQPSTKKIAGQFQFMKLPLEIRQMIYKNLLVFNNEVIRVSTCPGHRLFGGREAYLIPAGGELDPLKHELSQFPSVVVNEVMGIVSASKTIFSESLPIFYRHNRFHIDVREIRKFLTGIGPDRVRLLNDVIFNLGKSGHKEGCRALYTCSGLKKLHIIVSDEELNIKGAPHLPKVSQWGHLYWPRDIKHVVGMDWLTSIRGIDEFTCSPDGQQTYKHLKDLITKPKGWRPLKTPEKELSKDNK